nr:uncharacterized protein LOC117279415 [Nicotiana tomentosiformis]
MVAFGSRALTVNGSQNSTSTAINLVTSQGNAKERIIKLKRYLLQINTKKKQTRTEWIAKQTEAIDTKQQDSVYYNQAEVKDMHEPPGQTQVVTNGKRVVIQGDDHQEDDTELDFLVNYDKLRLLSKVMITRRMTLN